MKNLKFKQTLKIMISRNLSRTKVSKWSAKEETGRLEIIINRALRLPLLSLKVTSFLKCLNLIVNHINWDMIHLILSVKFEKLFFESKLLHSFLGRNLKRLFWPKFERSFLSRNQKRPFLWQNLKGPYLGQNLKPPFLSQIWSVIFHERIWKVSLFLSVLLYQGWSVKNIFKTGFLFTGLGLATPALYCVEMASPSGSLLITAWSTVLILSENQK